MPTTTYIVSLRRAGINSAPIDLRQVLTETSGVRIVGMTATQAQIEATPEAISILTSLIGQWCIIEEIVPRNVQ